MSPRARAIVFVVAMAIELIAITWWGSLRLRRAPRPTPEAPGRSAHP